MISKELAKSQVARLGGMNGFPIGIREAIEELVLAMQSADSEAIAKRAISGILDCADSETRCPMPKQIREAINAIQEPAYEAERPVAAVCSDCDDSGITGGLLGGPAAEWCMCSASTSAKLKNPRAVAEANDIWTRLSAAFGKKRDIRQVVIDEQRKRQATKQVSEILGALQSAATGGNTR